MPSLVHSLHENLVAQGEYVVLANIASGWFAIFESTLRKQTEIATKNGRSGPNLIVYRTLNAESEPRDHYVVPYEVFLELVTDATVAKAKVTRSRRWNMTLKSGQLRVTHGAGAVDVTPYYRAPLLLESALDPPPIMPSRPPVEFQSTEALEGIAKEYTTISRSRSTGLREAALSRSSGVCEACGVDFSSLFGGLGVRVLQVHHKNQLAHATDEVLTTLKDLAVVCANCHSIVHAVRERPMPVEELQALWHQSRGDA